MKQIELELKKRLLIVEYGDKRESELDFQTHKAFPESDKTVICLGSELSEDVVTVLVHQSLYTGLFAHYVKDIPVNTYCYKSASESLLSALQTDGYYWGENPLQSTKPTDDLSFYDSKKERSISISKWEEAESKTFDPNKTLIFEIL